MKSSSLIGILAVLVAGCAGPAGAPAGGGAGVEPAGESPAGRVAAVEQAPVAAAPVGSIEIGTLFGLVDSGGALLYDVRPALYFGFGHLPGAINLPRRKFEARIGGEEERILEARRSGRQVVLYCTNLECPDALAVAEELSRRGIPSRVYHAGWEEWKAAELPVE